MSWFRIRVAIILVAAVATLFVPAAPYEALQSLPRPMLILLGVFCLVAIALVPLMLLFVIGIQAASPLSDAT